MESVHSGGIKNLEPMGNGLNGGGAEVMESGDHAGGDVFEKIDCLIESNLWQNGALSDLWVEVLQKINRNAPASREVGYSSRLPVSCSSSNTVTAEFLLAREELVNSSFTWKVQKLQSMTGWNTTRNPLFCRRNDCCKGVGYVYYTLMQKFLEFSDQKFQKLIQASFVMGIYNDFLDDEMMSFTRRLSCVKNSIQEGIKCLLPSRDVVGEVHVQCGRTDVLIKRWRCVIEQFGVYSNEVLKDVRTRHDIKNVKSVLIEEYVRDLYTTYNAVCEIVCPSLYGLVSVVECAMTTRSK